jgi:hypothetical protein
MADKNETTDQGGENDARIKDLEAQVQKLIDKNKELSTEKQDAKRKAQEALDAADDAAQRAAEKNGDIDALKAAHAKELKKLQDSLEARDSDLRTIRVDNEIARSITEGNVRPEMAEALTALIKSKVAYENGAASIDGKAIAEHVTSYLGTDGGKHFKRAADHSGSGATGGDGSKATQFTRESILGDKSMEFQKLAATNPNEANAIADRLGMPDLKV